jgi:hypothetical protein
VQRAVKYARRQLGICVLPHRLRHGYATHCLERGANPRAIQQAMGHASLETTMGYPSTQRPGCAGAVAPSAMDVASSAPSACPTASPCTWKLTAPVHPPPTVLSLKRGGPLLRSQLDSPLPPPLRGDGRPGRKETPDRAFSTPDLPPASGRSQERPSGSSPPGPRPNGRWPPRSAAPRPAGTEPPAPGRRLHLGVLMAVAEFERAIIRERVNAGLRAARERGVRLGRPATNGQHTEAVRRLRAEGKGIRAIARELGLPVASVHKLAWRADGAGC